MRARARSAHTPTHTRPTVQGHCDLHCVTLCLAVLFNHFSLLCSRSNRVIAQLAGCTCCQVQWLQHVQHMVWPGLVWPGLAWWVGYTGCLTNCACTPNYHHVLDKVLPSPRPRLCLCLRVVPNKYFILLIFLAINRQTMPNNSNNNSK